MPLTNPPRWASQAMPLSSTKPFPVQPDAPEKSVTASHTAMNRRALRLVAISPGASGRTTIPC